MNEKENWKDFLKPDKCTHIFKQIKTGDGTFKRICKKCGFVSFIKLEEKWAE